MSEIVHGVDAPLITSAVVMGFTYAINQRVPHFHICSAHIDFRTKDAIAIVEFTVFHFLKKVEIFFNASISVRTRFACLGDGASVFSNCVFG